MKRRTLLAVGATWPGWGRADAPALVRAAADGDLASLRRLLDAGVPVDSRDALGRTALLSATHADRVDAARLLIERGANVNAKDDLQDSPFLYAGAEGRLAILRLTLAAGADLRSTNRYGGTALIPAAHHGHVETVRELLKTRIDVDHVNRLGWTALLDGRLFSWGATPESARLLMADVGAFASGQSGWFAIDSAQVLWQGGGGQQTPRRIANDVADAGAAQWASFHCDCAWLLSHPAPLIS
jgi:hypothetical protein